MYLSSPISPFFDFLQGYSASFYVELCRNSLKPITFFIFLRGSERSLFLFQKLFRKVRTSLSISPLSNTEGQKAPRKGGMSDVQKENQETAVGRGASARDKRNAVGVSHNRETARQETRRLSDA